MKFALIVLGVLLAGDIWPSFSFHLFPRSTFRNPVASNLSPQFSVSPDRSSSSGTAMSTGQLLVSLSSHLGKEKGQIRLILASQSPRRKEILDMMGLSNKFDTIPSPLDESALQVQLLGGGGDVVPGIKHVSDPKEYTRILAEEKAKALAEHLVKSKDAKQQQPTLVLGSDTIVEIDGDILEKPKDKEDAKRMLNRLSGALHDVHTGVALYRVIPADQEGSSSLCLVSSCTETAFVRFSNLSEADIDAYIESGEPMDKAGSYGIQGIGGQFVQSVEGDFFAVMGLPMHCTSKEIANAIRQVLEIVDE